MDRSRFGPLADPRALVGVLGNWSSGPEPLFRQLARAIDRAIEAGDLRPGDRLPAERDLARHLAVSRSTVVAALDQLRATGRLASRQGSGTWVPDRPASTPDDRARLLDTVARNPLVQGLLTTSSGTIELTAAITHGAPEVVAAAAAAVAEDLPALVREHGYMPYGLPQLRERVADHYTRRGVPTRPSQILVTSGIQQAISLVASAYVVPGAAVVVEDPTYVVALDTFRASTADLVGVPVTPVGPDPAELRERLERTRAVFAYLVPTNQNPTGATVPDDARREIARIAVELGTPIVEDEALAGLELPGTPTPRPIAAWAPDGPILSAGSLSKPAWGGLRVGWLRGPDTVITRLGRLKVLADYGSGVIDQAVAVRILDVLPELQAERQRLVAGTRKLLSELLTRHLPDWTWEPSTGGITAWIRIPVGDASAFAQVALRHGVAVVPGSLLSVSGGHGDHIRIAFERPDRLDEGVRRLTAAWAAYREDLDEPVERRLAWVV